MPLTMTIDGKTSDLQTDVVPDYVEVPHEAPAPTISKPAPKTQDTSKTTRARTTKPTKAEKPRTVREAPKPSPELDAAHSDGIRGLVQIGAVLALTLDARTPDDNISFRADAVTLASSADAIADAVTETARHNAQFAAVVDKITAAGPYAALVGVMFGVGMQLAANHGVQAAQMFGAKDPHVILQEVAENAGNPTR